MSITPDVAAGRRSRLKKAARLLLILSAVLAIYLGLSSLLLPFVGAPNLRTGIARWTAPAAGALQVIVAAAAFMLALRGDLRGATFASAACLLLGWLETLPPTVRHGLGV